MLVKYCEDDEASRTSMQDIDLSWDEFIAGPNLYEGCVTLNPNEVLDAWDTLTQDTFAVELSMIPQILRFAYLKTVEEYSGKMGEK